MILFHGTSTAYKERILREGLRPRCETGISNWSDIHNGMVESKPNLVYLTLAYPVYFAMQATEEPHDLLILKIEIDEEELYPDEDFLAYALKHQDNMELPLHAINPLVDPLENQQLATHCLQYNGIAAALQVSPKQIIDHKIIKGDDYRTILAIGGDSMPIPLNFKILGKLYQKSIEALFEQGTKAAVFTMTDRWNHITQLLEKP